MRCDVCNRSSPVPHPDFLRPDTTDLQPGVENCRIQYISYSHKKIQLNIDFSQDISNRESIHVYVCKGLLID